MPPRGRLRGAGARRLGSHAVQAGAGLAGSWVCGAVIGRGWRLRAPETGQSPPGRAEPEERAAQGPM